MTENNRTEPLGDVGETEHGVERITFLDADQSECELCCLGDAIWVGLFGKAVEPQALLYKQWPRFNKSQARSLAAHLNAFAVTGGLALTDE